LNEE